jgi:hypothetical protein
MSSACSRHRLRTTGRVLVAIALFVPARAAFACPVCFGRSDSPMAVGTNMAIFFMLGLTVAVLAAFGAFIVYLMRRARLADNAGPEDFHLDTIDPSSYLPETRFR